MKLAIVGSGPAGFYTAYRLLEKIPNAIIDMYEALPVPFGLSRFGVAPDHPEVKNCQDKFVEVAEKKNFRFIGHVAVGKDVKFDTLRQNYNSVILAYGSSEDRLLNIPGEESKGVFSAREFVGWYNGVPTATMRNLNPPLEDAEDVVIIGNGNVALDVARILLTDVEKLKTTDICEHAYEVLKKSKVKNVRIIGRRGLLQSAFTNKEIRELINVPNARMTPLNHEYIDHYKPFTPFLDRPLKRLVQILEKASTTNSSALSDASKQWSLEYLLSPKQFYPSSSNPNILSSTKFEINTLLQEDINSPSLCRGTGATQSFKSELAFRSIGYKPVLLRGAAGMRIPVDERSGRIPNEFGRVISTKGRQIPGLYVTGWVKNGPTGVIAKTMWDAFEVAETILEDLYSHKLDTSEKRGFEAVLPEINSTPVYWSDWLKIDQEEIRRGQLVGKPREKMISTRQMLSVI